MSRDSKWKNHSHKLFALTLEPLNHWRNCFEALESDCADGNHVDIQVEPDIATVSIAMSFQLGEVLLVQSQVPGFAAGLQRCWHRGGRGQTRDLWRAHSDSRVNEADIDGARLDPELPYQSTKLEWETRKWVEGDHAVRSDENHLTLRN
jgi:hypothetical protein